MDRLVDFDHIAGREAEIFDEAELDALFKDINEQHQTGFTNWIVEHGAYVVVMRGENEGTGGGPRWVMLWPQALPRPEGMFRDRALACRFVEFLRGKFPGSKIVMLKLGPVEDA